MPIEADIKIHLIGPTDADLKSIIQLTKQWYDARVQEYEAGRREAIQCIVFLENPSMSVPQVRDILSDIGHGGTQEVIALPATQQRPSPVILGMRAIVADGKLVGIAPDNVLDLDDTISDEERQRVATARIIELRKVGGQG